MAPGNARYASENGIWFLELSGDLRHTLGPALNALLDRAFASDGARRFLLDLSAAEAIDSTCLGVIARIASWSRERDAPRPIIVSSNEDIIETLKAVCFDRLFELRAELSTEAADWSDLSSSGVDQSQMINLILEAHRRLSAVDDSNKTVFRDVIEALERELDQDESGGKPS